MSLGKLDGFQKEEVVCHYLNPSLFQLNDYEDKVEDLCHKGNCAKRIPLKVVFSIKKNKNTFTSTL